MDEDPLPSVSHATGASIPNSPFLDPRFHALKSSSPPPLFSENDSLDTADVTNYESPREKRKRAGTWWQAGPRGAPKRRQFNRNFDSGVYMMSDDSGASAPPSSVMSHLGFDGACDIPSDPPLAPWHPDNQDEGIEHTAESMSASEIRLCRAIQDLLDAGTTYFDFDFDLQDQELHHLHQLNQIITLPPGDGIEAPVEGQYRSMIPELHLNLSFNKLRYLSPTLFQLQHLTTLTLRNNSIVSIPPQIKELINLHTLDLCHNSIFELPCELLAICAMQRPGRLTRLELAHNPLYDFKDDLCEIIKLPWPTVGERLPLYDATSGQHKCVQGSWKLMQNLTDMDWSVFEGHHLYTPPRMKAHTDNPDIFDDKVFLVCRTAASYYDHTGQLLKNSHALPNHREPDDSLDTSRRGTVRLSVTSTLPSAENAPEVWFDRPSSSKVLSLSTISLIKAYKTEPDRVREEIDDYIGGSIPGDIGASLDRAEDNEIWTFKPLRCCHCCGREYIIPRAEWFEGWWFQEQLVPIRVAVCSWGCVPDVIAKKPEPFKFKFKTRERAREPNPV